MITRAKSLKIPLLLSLVVFAAGCATLTDLFGSDVVNVQQRTVQNGERDVLVIRDIQTIPRSPLLPDQQVLLSFLVENKDALKSSVARVDLFDAPTMRDASGNYPCNLYSPTSIGELPDSSECPSGERCITPPNLCTGGGSGLSCFSGLGICCTIGLPSTPAQAGSQRYCTPDPQECGTSGCTVLPGEEKPVNFVMKTPTESDIKNIKTEATLNFKTTYSFDGSLNYILSAVNMQEIIKRQRTGEKIDLDATKSHSSGPVQIDVELQGAPYLLSNLEGITDVNPESILFFTVRNTGSGNLVSSQIDEGALEIIFPGDFIVTPNEKFACNNNRCINNKRSPSGESLGVIPLYRDESRSSLRFAVRLADRLVEPFRSYQITANVRYNYELRNSVDVTVNPFQNV